jgi:hypothetical protein
MKCGGRYENIRLQMGECHLKNHVFSIEMGCCDINLVGYGLYSLHD